MAAPNPFFRPWTSAAESEDEDSQNDDNAQNSHQHDAVDRSQEKNMQQVTCTVYSSVISSSQQQFSATPLLLRPSAAGHTVYHTPIPSACTASRTKAQNFKMSSEAKRTLMEWYNRNIDNPFPSQETLQTLAQNCNIPDVNKVSKWFSNQRFKDNKTKGFVGRKKKGAHAKDDKPYSRKQ